jgi:predicted acylesterase/phospholipase RssA
MPSETLKKCDILMKGGITSGIVYPGLICKLAEHYEFQSIGGTSAGAIAAALTAAAELGRRKGLDSFRIVKEVPEWLGKPSEDNSGSNLFSLFEPQRAMKVLFRLATAFLVQGWTKRALRAAKALWIDALLGILPAVAFLWIASPVKRGWWLPVAVAIGLVTLFGGLAISVLAGMVVRLRRVPTHFYGLCTGWVPKKEGQAPSLTGWLNEKINSAAGITDGHPLTFGDLKNSGITLKVISTCLTFGRPYTLPFESPEFFYSPEEMRQFFPASVVRWMEEHPATWHKHDEPINADGLKLLPDHDNLPVVVATRLSLSFPFLFCAVPLYAVDWSRRRKRIDEAASKERVPGDALEHDETRRPEIVWFSDGGICSNFPLHLFDSPLPKWPTFGINLRDLRADRVGRVWTPETTGAGVAHLWTRLPSAMSLGAAGSFFSLLFDSARNWMDSLQTFVPGYRDRIVHVYLDKREGGLNLNMPKDVVASLSGYGELAADRLIGHFLEGTGPNGQPTTMTWDHHRWTRCRSTMALLEEFLADLAYSVGHPESGDRTLLELISRGPEEPPKSYAFTDEQREEAKTRIQTLVELGHCTTSLQPGAPKPAPALRIRPTF